MFSHSKGQPKKCWSGLDSQFSSESLQSPTDHVEANEQTQPQDAHDALNQTVIEILSSLSEKSNPKVNAEAKDKEISGRKARLHTLKRKLTVNDRERVEHFYDKSCSMNAPKPSNVPIF